MVITWNLDDVGSQKFGPFLLVPFLCDVACTETDEEIVYLQTG